MALPPVSARGGTRKLPRHPEAAQLSNTLLRGCSVAWLQQMETLGVDDIETAREDALTEGDELRAIRIMEYALFVRSRSDEMSERGLAEYFEELTTSYNSLAMENVEAVRHRHCLSLVFPPLFFAKTVPFLAVLQGEADAKGLDVGVIIHTKKPEHEFTLEEYESTFNDFCDMAMQFGFCTLFGVGETTETPPMIKIPRITFCCDDRAVPLEVLLSVLHRS